MTFISVLVPAPFSPISACTSPWRSSRSTPSSAIVGPNDLLIFESLRATDLHGLFTDRLKSVVEGLGRRYCGAFVGTGDCQDTDVVVVRQRQCFRIWRHINRI